MKSWIVDRKLEYSQYQPIIFSLFDKNQIDIYDSDKGRIIRHLKTYREIEDFKVNKDDSYLVALSSDRTSL